MTRSADRYRVRRLSCIAGMAAGILVLALVLLADRGWYHRYTGESSFKMFPGGVISDLGLVIAGKDKAKLSAKLAARVEKRIDASDQTALRMENRRWGGADASVPTLLSELCEIRGDFSSATPVWRMRVSSGDQFLATRLSRSLQSELMMFTTRNRIERRMIRADAVSREIQRLGKEAPPELIAEYRNLSVGEGLEAARIRPDGNPVVSVERLIIWPRLGQSFRAALALGAVAGCLTALAFFLVSHLIRRLSVSC